MLSKKKKIFIFMTIAILFSFFFQGNLNVIPLTESETGISSVVNQEPDQEPEISKPQLEEKENLEEKLPDKEQPIDNREEQASEALKEKEDNIKDKDLKAIAEEQKELKNKIIEEDLENVAKKDKYLTDPVPEGKPKPVEWQDVTINEEKDLQATLSVTCKTILNNLHLFNKDKLEVLPEDGIIYLEQKVTFYEGESVFEILLREMKGNGIHMEFVMTPIYNSNYVAGINNLYEFDCGELSGWMYRVNGWFPNYGCSRYMVKDGDVIEWIYTADLGRDIGGEYAIGGTQE